MELPEKERCHGPSGIVGSKLALRILEQALVPPSKGDDPASLRNDQYFLDEDHLAIKHGSGKSQNWMEVSSSVLITYFNGPFSSQPCLKTLENIYEFAVMGSPRY